MDRRTIHTVTIVCLLAVGYHAVAGQSQLQVLTDSIDFRSGEITGSVAFGDLSDYDTLRFWGMTDVTFSSESDSIKVTKTAPIVPVIFAGPDRRLNLSIWFDSWVDRAADKLKLLRKHAVFGNTPPPEGWDFSYALPVDPHLTALREKYHLDSIAGDGSELERALRLMRWVHQTVRHDGSSYNPSPQNALHLLQVCADSGRGINCRMMATVLNEACLSVGIKSRHLTCLPGDTADTECHVVNMIWSDSLSKWTMIDPTYNGYFTDANGTLLGPIEVRDALIKGDPLTGSTELDYNGSPYDPDQYKGYMTKNLFRFMTPLVSAFGYESWKDDTYQVALNPVGYQTESLAQIDTIGELGSRWLKLYTDNAAWFWKE
jgi:hypothetical protein